MSRTKRTLDKLETRELMNQNEKAFTGLRDICFDKIPCPDCRNNRFCERCKGFKYLYRANTLAMIEILYGKES